MFTYLFDRFLRRVFSLLRVNGILCIHKALAWRHGFFYLSKILSAFFTRSLARDSAPTVHDDLCSKTDFLYPYFRWWKKGSYFRFRVLANHLASIFFLPLSGDSLGSPSLSPGHRVQTSVGFHPDPHSLLSPTGHEELTYITISLVSGQ